MIKNDNSISGISVVICTYNGKSKLTHTLNAICQLETKCNWELLIVDNASTDGTSDVVKEFLATAIFDWQLLYERKPGLIHARLCGLRAAKYDILLYCDDDNTLDKSYVQLGYEIFSQNSILGALGGCGIPVLNIEKPEWFDTYSHSFAVGPQANENGILKEYPAELYGAGTLFRKQPLLKFLDKGFQSVLSGRKGDNLASGEDVEWCYLIQLAGYKIGYDNRLIFEHLLPSSRINWDYYLQLKSGIASGTGKLVPYHLLFKNKKATSFQYAWVWFTKTILTTLRFFKYQCLIFLKKSSANKIDLALIILRSKMLSFYKSPLHVYFHFRRLKKII